MEKQKKRKQKREADIVENKKDAALRNRETNIISFVFAGLFMLMMGYLIYFNVAVAPNVINNPYNKRIDNQETKVVRGDILAADGSVLATTETDDEGVETRSYPYGSLFCHVIGLSSAKTGVEGQANYDLLSESDNIISQLISDASGDKAMGDTVVTTLDVDLQQAAYDAIGDNKGAVIVMEPSTGKILAMVSKPDYDPNLASTDYNEWLTYDSADSVLLNRATQGLYPPGSTFKILTALEYMREYDADSYEYYCTGSAYVQGGTTIPCSNEKQHGTQSLKTAFANSCNSAFSTIGLDLDKAQFKRLCSTFLFNSSLPLGIEYSTSSFTLDENSGISEVQETAIGQGKTMISPIHNLLITATIANGGVLMTPYLVDSVQTAGGDVVKQTQPSEYGTLMSTDEAYTLTEYMRAVVTSGTGSALKYASYNAAGKTGSAQYDSSEDVHSWFVGFAPYDDPEIAVCVILEGGYSGVSSAQYVAKKVFDAYFN
jgi:cell division protein FtsI/penicillin-binding protein 2